METKNPKTRKKQTITDPKNGEEYVVARIYRYDVVLKETGLNGAYRAIPSKNSTLLAARKVNDNNL